MPTSDSENKDVVLRWYKQINPEKVMDIGVGEGTYSRLINKDTKKRQAKWVGIEAWAPYINEFSLKDLYDNIIIGDAYYLDYSKICGKGIDLVIAGDVLEHLTKTEARELISEFKKYSNHIIISVPLLHLHQDSVNGNWFERHLDHWSYEEMCRELGGGLVESIKGPTLGYFYWSKV